MIKLSLLLSIPLTSTLLLLVLLTNHIHGMKYSVLLILTSGPKVILSFKLIHHSILRHQVCKGCPFLIKCDEHGNTIHWKVYFIFKGFEQIYGKDYICTTSPTAHMES